MSLALSRWVGGVLSRWSGLSSSVVGEHCHGRNSPWFTTVLTLKTSAPLRAEPKKKKKTEAKKEQMMRDRLRRKIKKMEKSVPQLIPIEDLMTQFKHLDETRQRPPPRLTFEESERRALLLKEWCRYKQREHIAEMKAINLALEVQREALKELKIESEELYLAAIKPDPLLFPFSYEGPSYTPPKPNYNAPEGKYTDITQVHTQS